jgi:hypothetical protein
MLQKNKQKAEELAFGYHFSHQMIGYVWWQSGMPGTHHSA